MRFKKKKDYICEKKNPNKYNIILWIHYFIACIYLFIFLHSNIIYKVVLDIYLTENFSICR